LRLALSLARCGDGLKANGSVGRRRCHGRRTPPGPAAAEVLARAYEKATAGTSTWYRTGKRAVHQPQLERFVGELTHYLDNVTAIVELGAGKGLLGRVLQDVSAISRGDRGALPLVAIEQRECPTYDSREHDVTRLNGTSVAQGFVLDDKIPHGALVIAKHFCGNASDEAVRLILASERVALAALAPCCHPAMQWDAFCAREAKGPLGALLTEAHFPVLLDLIALSRHGRGGSSGRDCKRWESLQALGADSCYRAGRAARVVLEAARLQQLAAAGFSTALVEYVGSGTAPDNLILLAARPSSSLERGLGPLIQTPRPSGLHLPPCGVVLHTAAKGASQTERLAEYLQELRERGERAIESVEMHTLELALAETTRDDPRLTRDLPETYLR